MNGTDIGGVAAGSPVAGLDWSWDQHAVCVLDSDGRVLERLVHGRPEDDVALVAVRLQPREPRPA